MMYEQTYQQAVDDIESLNLSIIENGVDLYVYPIPDSVIAKVRSPFKLHLDEEILFVRDTGFWNDGTQGTVVTDWGITIVADNDNPEDIFQIKWVDVEYVEYSAKRLYFFFSRNDRNNNTNVHISFFLKGYDDEEICRNNGEILADIFTRMAETQSGDNAEKALERMKEFHKNEDYEHSLEEANNVLSMSNDEDKTWEATLYKAFALKYIAQSYDWDDETSDDEKEKQMGHRETYLRAADETFQELEEMRGQEPWIFNERAWLRCGGTNFANKEIARRFFIAGMKGDPEDKKTAIDGYEWTTKLLFSEFDGLKTEYPEFLNDPNFSEEEKLEMKDFYESSLFTNSISFGDRQFLVLAKSKNQIAGYFDPEDNIKWVFTLDKIPHELVFEGAPSANVLYMAHPIKTNYYLPYENAEEKLFMEKVREFCYLVQCLGATEVTFHSIKGLSISQTSSYNMNLGGNVDTIFVDANADGNYSGKNSSKKDGNKEIGIRQTFNPTQKPFCPNDLVWLDADATWRMIVKQRLEGSMLNYHYRIKSSETCNLTNNQVLDVKASYKSMMVDVNVNYKDELDQTFSKHEETEWEISVTFKPIHEFGSNNTTPNNSKALSSAENEYLTELKEIITDGEITARERRLLDKIRASLGLSKERAIELEDSLSPKLSPEEQEYLDEYKEIIADGDISARDLRFLDKLKKANGISDSRAKELENMMK